MKIIEHYVCEHCGHEYETEEACQGCENNHKIELTIETCKYIPYIEDPNGLPKTIEIGYEENGEPKRAVYRR